MAVDTTRVVLPYHEPSIVLILILTSFLLILNAVNHIIDRILYVGLLGQVFIGIAWGTPGGKWLEPEFEAIVVSLGYLGLLLLVYEGGLTTSFVSLKANLWLSLFVAMTGIVLSVGFSYILMIIANATPLQAFAAGAALCSTSLGTTFTVMQTSGLNITRMGVVLASAAMMDDVVGLVMIQVISNLGNGSSSFRAVTVIRPVFVSLAFGFSVPMACRLLILPFTIWLNDWRTKAPGSMLSKLLLKQETAFIIHTTVLVGMITSATYAGTSNLFAAYLTGAAISWWDSDVPHDISPIQYSSHSTRKEVPIKATAPHQAAVDSSDDQITFIAPTSTNQGFKRTKSNQDATLCPPGTPAKHQGDHDHDQTSGITTFETYYHQPLRRILKPFFFASIGFSIPITRMFAGSIIWRGFVYTILMFLAKVLCGLWLIRVETPAWLMWLSPKKSKTKEAITTSKSMKSENEPENKDNAEEKPQPIPATQQANSSSKLNRHTSPSHQTFQPANPISLYPGAIVGCAMVARGEIGFLISALAEANGIFGKEANAPLFLTVTWAIMLCTVIGPICVGLMVKRWKGVSEGRNETGEGRRDVLGVWGVG